ncbi:MAG: hypothetical protein ABFE13_20625 [Phycisphaerales bacterium]
MSAENRLLGVPGVPEFTEHERTKSGMMGRISFWLAVSPWFYVVASLLRLPGFG